MTNPLLLTPVAHIRNDFKEKFGVPRQSGRAPSLRSEIIFLPAYRREEALRGIEGFSHLWLLFDFSLTHGTETHETNTHGRTFSPTVRPPRLGGNQRVGVFASRSPFRPNPIGLSCVKLVGVEKRGQEGLVLIVSGADLVDGTPILDIKPYLPFADCIPSATAGYAEQGLSHKLRVDFPPALLEKIPTEKRAGLLECLADDPRPSYQDDPEKGYGMRFGEFQIHFTVCKDYLTIDGVEKG